MNKFIVIASEQRERSNPQNFSPYGLLRRRCLLAMTAVLSLAACAGYKSPSLSGDPAKMSADTLCYRYDGKADSPIGKEIAARNLDCMEVLRADPLYSGSTTSRDLDTVHRVFR